MAMEEKVVESLVTLCPKVVWVGFGKYVSVRIGRVTEGQEVNLSWTPPRDEVDDSS